MAIRAALVWIGVQFALATVPLAAYAVYIIKRGSPLGAQATNAQFLLVGLAMLVLAGVFARYSGEQGLTLKDLGYRLDARMAGIGLLAGLILIPFIEGADRLDRVLFKQGLDVDTVMVRHLREGGLVTASLLIGINGVLTPVVEDFAWRGYIQTHLPGVRGVLVTAALFAVKHVVTDLSVSRLTVLLVASLALGYIRYRWSTTSSTATHLFLNLFAGVWSIIEARRPPMRTL